MRALRAITRIINRALPALLMAASVVLLSAGIFSFAPLGPETTAVPTSEPGDPNFEPTPTGGAVVDPTATPDGPSPTGVAPTDGLPSQSPGASPGASGSPGPGDPTATPGGPSPTGGSPGPTTSPAGSPGPTSGPGTPGPTSRPSPTPAGRELATRIVIPAMDIDLAVLPGDLQVPGNRNSFPLCDVAQYLTTLSQPGQKGTTYIYAHARTGMFLPLLEASRRNNGRSMIGRLVEVYTSHNRMHIYEIYRVKRHATDLSLADQLPPGGEQLIMQTSEGPRGTLEKLQVAARPLTVVPADPREANPTARPRVCR